MTLAEALLAIGLCTVMVLLLGALAISALRSNQKSADQAVASSLGAQALEQFAYALPRSNAAFWSTSAFASPYQTNTVQLGNTTFESDLFLSDLSAAGPGTRLATVNVSWGSGSQGRTGYGQQVTTIARLVYAH